MAMSEYLGFDNMLKIQIESYLCLALQLAPPSPGLLSLQPSTNSSGYCQPGQMLAIMGPSGAGKTTLLAMISKKNDPRIQIEGKILANNQQFGSDSFYNFGAYVYQNDLLHDCLSVKETLSFIAQLKIKQKQSGIKRVNQLVQEFQLQRCQNVKVGGSTIKGISGGEKKRVCIAIEMITKPSLLILDQPTSGLDSSKAAKVLKILKKLASEGRTIIFTLHQPSYLQYSLLDRLILLRLGETVYQGKASQIEQYMSQTLLIKVPLGRTISDFFMMEISEYRAKLKEGERYETRLNSFNFNKYLRDALEREIYQMESNESSKVATSQLKSHIESNYEATYMANPFNQFLILLRRQFLLYIRNPMRVGQMLLNAIMKILIVGYLFSGKIPSRSQLHSQPTYLQLIQAFISIQSVAFINVAGNIIPFIFAVSLSFPAERDIYCKEKMSKKYYSLPFFFSKLIIEWVSLFFGVLIYTSGGYWLNGYTGDLSHFLKFTLIMLVAGFTGNSIGTFGGTIFKNIQQVSSMTPIILIPMMAFSGMFNRLSSIPSWISWMQYISPFRYGLHMTLLNQFGNQNFRSTDGRLYDYRSDLAIEMGLWENFLIAVGIGVLFYALSFIFLVKMSSKISA